MEVYNEFKNQLRDIVVKHESCFNQHDLIQKIEENMFPLFLSFDTKLNAVYKNLLEKDDKLHEKDDKLHEKDDKLHEKNDELLKTLRQLNHLEKKLFTAKESTHKIIKCLNISLKASTNIVARTIIESISRQEARLISSSIDALIDKFCREKMFR